jgi:threonine aldolase
MSRFTRRTFLRAGAACAALESSRSLSPAVFAAPSAAADEGPVNFLTDGLRLSPRDYTQLLMRLEQAGKIRPDSYLAGGTVEELEKRFTQILGKERAVFVPTGTLANHLAIRRLAGGKSRALVQAESHIYNDSLDCVQTLSHLNLVPLASGQATFTLGQVEEACKRATDGPFPTPVGVIAIECPVRRRQGETFDYEEMQRIAAVARKQGIKMHLDGARLFIASAYTGIAPAAYAALFDTVYISLYKCFNAAAGAVLAGPREVIEAVAHDRKMFGGGLRHAWPYAAVALHYLEGYLERLQRAVAAARELFVYLEKHLGFRVESLPHGTNIHKLHMPGVDVNKYRTALEAKGILIPTPAAKQGFHGVLLYVNESLNRRPVGELARGFVEALPARG